MFNVCVRDDDERHRTCDSALILFGLIHVDDVNDNDEDGYDRKEGYDD